MRNIILITLFYLLVGCSTIDVNPDRAGCTFIDGQGRYGTLTQYIKGNSKGVYVHYGNNQKASITCNAETQEITISFNNED